MKVIHFLKGKKSYIVAALMVALGLLQGNTELVLEGLSVAALRAGISSKQ